MSQVYDPLIHPFLKSMRIYLKKIEKFAGARPTPEAAKTAADEAFRSVLASVSNDALRSKLEQLISDNSRKAISEIENAQSLSDMLRKHENGKNELAMGNNIGLSVHNIEKIILKTSKITYNLPEDQITIESIIESATRIHLEVINKLDAARTLPKDQKKRRKRDLMSASASASFGVSIIVMNLVAAPTFWLSLAAGMAPLGQALRDVVGTRQ